MASFLYVEINKPKSFFHNLKRIKPTGKSLSVITTVVVNITLCLQLQSDAAKTMHSSFLSVALIPEFRQMQLE